MSGGRSDSKSGHAKNAKLVGRIHALFKSYRLTVLDDDARRGLTSQSACSITSGSVIRILNELFTIDGKSACILIHSDKSRDETNG